MQEIDIAAAGVENELRNFSSFGTYLEQQINIVEISISPQYLKLDSLDNYPQTGNTKMKKGGSTGVLSGDSGELEFNDLISGLQETKLKDDEEAHHKLCEYFCAKALRGEIGIDNKNC